MRALLLKFEVVIGTLAKLIEVGKVFLFTIIAGRCLTVMEFGVYSLLLSIAAIVAILAEFRIQDVIYKKVNNGEGVPNVLGSSLFIVAMFAFIGHLVLVGVSVLEFIDIENNDIYIFYGVIFYLNISKVFKTVMLAQGNSLTIIFAEVLSFFFAILYLSTALENGSVGLIDIVISRVVDLFILTVILLFFTLQKNNISYPDWSYVKGIMKSSAPLVLSGMAVILYQKIDQIMIKIILGYDVLGQYAANLSVVTIFSIIPMMYAQVAAKRIHRDENKIIFYMRDISYLGIVLSVFLFTFGSGIVQLSFGERYIISDIVWYPLSIIPFLIATGAAAAQIIISGDRQSLIWTKSLIALLLNIILNLMLIPFIGLLGAAIATSVSLLVGNVISNLLISRYRYVFVIQIKSIFYREHYE